MWPPVFQYTKLHGVKINKCVLWILGTVETQNITEQSSQVMWPPVFQYTKLHGVKINKCVLWLLGTVETQNIIH